MVPALGGAFTAAGGLLVQAMGRTTALSLTLVIGGVVLLILFLLQYSAWLDLLSRGASSAVAKADLLTKEHERQQAAIDAMADGLEIAIFICDTKGAIGYANRKAMELFSFDHPKGRSILAVTLSYDVEKLITEVASDFDPREVELNLSYPEDRVVLIRAWTDPERMERVFLSVLDITDLRRLERVRQDFVANVSHELRTPMTSIRAMTESMQEEPDNRELRERYLTKIIQEVDRLTSISSDLLILSAAESGPPKTESVDLWETVEAVALQLRAKANKKQLTLNVHGKQGIFVQANPDQLTQVVLNLIDNAISYTKKGSVTVDVTSDAAHAMFKVTDTGVGISSEHLPRIFERFYRVDKARSRDSGGTGLGLSIVKHIVESLGGAIEVSSDLNRGSSFVVRIPLST